MALALVATSPHADAAHAASWLDGPPAAWNTPGLAGPPQALAEQNRDLRCKARERDAGSAPERRVAGAGWKLEDYWPTIASGGLQPVTALSGYDGMCRPMAFNVFVFSNGVYAGTLSPVPMSARADGVLSGPPDTGISIAPDGSIRAAFIRYAPTDPLCCPSGGIARVTYQVRQVGDESVVVPVDIASGGSAERSYALSPRAQRATQLPLSGGGGGATRPTGFLAIIAGALVACSLLAFRQPRRAGGAGVAFCSGRDGRCASDPPTTSDPDPRRRVRPSNA